jgi:hypothetical protein
LTLEVSRPKAVDVRRPRPTLTVTARLSRAATMSLRLLDRDGRELARWSRRAPGAGTLRLTLPLPPRARRAGTARLRVEAGADPVRARVVPVQLRA